MKIALIVSWLASVVAALGAPPSDAAGMKFQKTVLAQSIFDSTTIELLLNADGTYTGLRRLESRQGTSDGGAGGSVLISVLADISIPQNGTWTYRVVDQATAIIVLDGAPLRLHFDDGLPSGRVGEPIPGTLGLIPYFKFSPYDATTRLANCSTRCYVAPGRSVSFGFVISEGERRVLVRAVGPGLRTFGITQPLENPTLGVYRTGSSEPVDGRLPPSSRTTLAIAAERAGAFPLPSANDRSKFLTIQKGAYIAEVAATDGAAAGEVLVEVYQLP